MALQVGERIGDYQVIGILGAGGMGKVYKVRNTISERIEAMKVLLPNLQSDPELGERFMREIKVQASLEHTNIASLHTALRIDNQLLMVMEFVEGRSIEDLMQPGPLPIDAAMDYVSQVLSALSYAHARGVIHRDIKPANMMVTPTGVVKLMDFGIAKMTQDRKLTQTGTTVGSLYYMSPEQIQGTNLDARSDLYSLGVSLYETVTGKRPFQGDSDYSIMAAHLQQDPVPPLQLDPRLPAVLNEIILMSISKDPTARFQSADAFRAALDSVRRTLGSIPASAQAPTPIPQAPFAPPIAAAVATAPSSRRGLYIALGSVLTLAVLALGAFQLPKLFKASASGMATAPAATSSAPPATPATLPVTVAPPLAAPPDSGATATTIAPPPVTPLPTNPRERPGASGISASKRQPRSPGNSGNSPSNSGNNVTPPLSSGVTPASQAPAEQAQASHPIAQQPPPPAQPAMDSGRMRALTAMQERMMQMAARVNAARTSLDNFKKTQQSQGLGLRGDITAANSRLEYQMDQGESAIKAGDPAAARRSLDAAERELDKLENFLGR